jgi:hypothetical protein
VYNSGEFESGCAMAELPPDLPPDRLSVEPESPHHNADLLARGVNIRFQGKERTDVVEYCVSEGWVRVPVGTSRDRFGRPMTIKLKGPVEPYFPEKPASSS